MGVNAKANYMDFKKIRSPPDPPKCHRTLSSAYGIGGSLRTDPLVLLSFSLPSNTRCFPSVARNHGNIALIFAVVTHEARLPTLWTIKGPHVRWGRLAQASGKYRRSKTSRASELPRPVWGDLIIMIHPQFARRRVCLFANVALGGIASFP